jgi:hypothetical protein
MRSNVARTCNILLFGAPQESDIVCLEDQDNNPIHACYNGVDAETARIMVILSPYCVAVLMLRAIGRLIEGIDGARYDKYEPGHDCKDLVGQEIPLGKLFAFGEWVVYRYTVSCSCEMPEVHALQSVSAIVGASGCFLSLDSRRV